MKIAVIGGGAIGMLICSYLQPVCDVTLYVRRLEQKQQIDKHGLVRQTGNTSKVLKLKVDILSNQEIDADYIFVTVKQYDLASILDNIKNIKEHQTIVFLQNGMGHLKYAKELEKGYIVLGVVEHGALKVNDWTVNHTGIGRTKLASYGIVKKK